VLGLRVARARGERNRTATTTDNNLEAARFWLVRFAYGETDDIEFECTYDSSDDEFQRAPPLQDGPDPTLCVPQTMVNRTPGREVAPLLVNQSLSQVRALDSRATNSRTSGPSIGPCPRRGRSVEKVRDETRRRSEGASDKSDRRARTTLTPTS